MALRILNLVKIESLYVVTAIEFTWCVVESASEPDIGAHGHKMFGFDLHHICKLNIFIFYWLLSHVMG